MTSRTRWRGAVGWSLLVLRIGACAAIVLIRPEALHAAFDPASVFSLQCAGCHSVGQGVVVGPDLAGVTKRHPLPWLRAFIRSSQSVIQSGDPAAKALFDKFKKRMPDHDFTDAEIQSLLGFLEAGGPAAREKVRLASAATPAEVALGHDLFTGERAFAHGGAACADCHAAGGAGRWRAGALASDLSRIYPRYQDPGLDLALARLDFPLMASYHDRPLTADEIFALKAFLYQTARTPAEPVEVSSGGLLFLGFGSSSLALWLAHRAGRRRRGGTAGPR